ncbi:histone-like nucleoid-structuring protein Lsr2 [Streptomyces sp. NPDC049555]|uniref:Lsr2 dimerization domain-containing protein n=1 Tax=Streptomyces sp. NPDC049555 TaxID=3154930 RepID=UPI003449B0FC
MAKHVETVLIDDLTGERGGSVSEHVIALDGRGVTVDLGASSFAELEEKLAPYFAAGRWQRRVAATRPSRMAAAEARQEPSTAEIRAWAKRRRIKVAERGRIPHEVRQQFLASQSDAA